MNIVLPTGPYDVAVIDPPWSYYGSPDKDQAAGKHYALLDDAAIASLRIKELLAPRGVAFLWTTSPRLDSAIDCIRAWGLAYRGIAFVWVKTRADGGVISGQGVRPSIVKPTTELVLAASPVAKGRPLPLSNESVGQVVLAPRGAHSQKPDAVQERIEAMYPTTRKVELFARRRRLGWDAWGNEVPV